MKPLSPRRARFVQEYLVDLNAPAAAARAGYRIEGKNPYCYQLAREPEVALAIRQGMDERARGLKLTAAMVVAELMAIGFSDMRRIASWRALPPRPVRGEPGRTATDYVVELRDSGDIDDASAAAIASLRRDGSGAPVIRLHDKVTALALLGRHLGLFGPARAGIDGQAVGGEAPEDPAKMRVLVDAMSALGPERRAALRETIRAAVEEGLAMAEGREDGRS